MTISDPYAALTAADPPQFADPSRPDPFAGFRTVGQRSGALPPRVRLHSEQLLGLAAVDSSTDKGHGTVRGLRYLVKDDRAPEHELIDLLLAVEVNDPKTAAAYSNPCELRRAPEPGSKELSGADMTWLDQMAQRDPATIDDDDARVLASWYVDVGTRSERKLIERVLDPVRRRHDRMAEEAELRPIVALGSRTVPCREPGWRKAWEALIAERMSEEAKVKLYPTLGGVAPEQREKLIALAEQEAHEAARARLATLWAGQEAERRQAAAEAATRLSALAAGAEPATSAPVVPDDVAEADLAAARRRGQQWRAEHDASSTNPWGGFRIVGSGS